MKPGPKSFKLEDPKELQALIAEQLDAVERGLRLLDTGVELGSATVDFAALDADGRLALIAIGVDANDEMMMRALDAYVWCVEDPDVLQRLYPKVRLAPGQPPRVIFLAERVPEAFRRKIKHLRFNRVDCFEFRFGLLFSLVEEVRGTHDVPTAAPPRAPEARRGERAEAAAGAPAPVGPRAEPASRPEGRRRGEPAPPPVPAAPAPPTSQWGQGGSKPIIQIDEDRVRVVREYLQRDFPAAVIYDFYSHELGRQMFHLQDNHGAVIHSATVAEDLLTESSDVRLTDFLTEHKLTRALRDAGTAAVSVTRTGLQVERR